MAPSVLTLRALSTEFARRIYVPTVLAVSALSLILLVVAGWLVTVSGWWWFLLVPLILGVIVFITLSIISWVAIRLLRPSQTTAQRQMVKAFVDKLEGLSEVMQTPKFVIVFRLVKDVMFTPRQSYIDELTGHVITLRPDFEAILNSYR